MAEAKKYWLGPGNLRVEKGIMVREGEELTKNVIAKCGGKDDKDGSKWVTYQMEKGKVGEKIAVVSAAGRPTKEVIALKALVIAKDKVIEELQDEIAELKGDSGGKDGEK